MQYAIAGGSIAITIAAYAHEVPAWRSSSDSSLITLIHEIGHAS